MPWYETFDFRKEAIVDKFYGKDILKEYCKNDVNATMVAFENYIMGMRKEIDMNKKSYEIEKVIFNDPATIILWKDGTKTVVKCCEFDSYDPYVGVSIAINKKLLGDDYKRVFKKALSFYEEPEEEEYDYDLCDELVSVNNLKIKLDELKRAFNKLNLASTPEDYEDIY